MRDLLNSLFVDLHSQESSPGGVFVCWCGANRKATQTPSGTRAPRTLIRGTPPAQLMIALSVYKVVSIALVLGLAGTSGAAAYYYRQQGTAQQTVLQDANLQDSYKARIADLQSQIASLNSQISQLQSLNTQLGGNNAQLISQIQQLQSQVSQLQSQVAQLQAQIANLNALLRLQNSRVIANQVTVDRQAFTSTSNAVIALVNIGQIQYAGYLRVSWTSPPRMNFGIQEYDINITTPVTASGVYNVPVGANATGNAWFQCFDYYFVNGVYICTSSFTYSITYWY